jgi:hypothetical protein
MFNRKDRQDKIRGPLSGDTKDAKESVVFASFATSIQEITVFVAVPVSIRCYRKYYFIKNCNAKLLQKCYCSLTFAPFYVRMDVYWTCSITRLVICQPAAGFKSCNIATRRPQNCCFYKEFVQKLKFLNNSIVIL